MPSALRSDSGAFRMIRDLDAEVWGNLCLDRLGWLWVGTVGRGLYCYDLPGLRCLGRHRGFPRIKYDA